VYDNVNGPFSFDYPKTWEIKEFDPDPQSEGVILNFGSSTAKGGLDSGTYAFISSVPQTKNPWYTNAYEYLQFETRFGTESTQYWNEYTVLGSGEIIIGGAKADWMADSYHYIRSPGFDLGRAGHWVRWYAAIYYNNRVYEFGQRVNADFDSYEEFKPGFDTSEDVQVPELIGKQR